jgi:hypothetical protein
VSLVETIFYYSKVIEFVDDLIGVILIACGVDMDIKYLAHLEVRHLHKNHLLYPKIPKDMALGNSTALGLVHQVGSTGSRLFQ